MGNTGTGTWHYGLMARWWAEFNVAEPHELAYFRTAIKQFGEPVLDLGCGTGRILLPLLEEGFDIDGLDVSADMIAHAQELASRKGLKPRLSVQAMHELDTGRTYRSVYICGALGIGAQRDDDRQTLRRVHQVLAPSGALLITDHEPPFGPDSRIPAEWPASGQRRRAANGDEIELISRLAEIDAAENRLTLEIRARLWREGKLVTEEQHSLSENLYTVPEMLTMLQGAGFSDVTVTANYADRPATADDAMVSFVARKR